MFIFGCTTCLAALFAFTFQKVFRSSSSGLDACTEVQLLRIIRTHYGFLLAIKELRSENRRTTEKQNYL